MRKCIQKPGFFIALIVLLGCEKELFDYRNKFIGDWEFKVERSEINTNSIGYSYHDSLSYSGRIKYGDADDDLFIQYSDENSITLKIDKENQLSDFPTHYCSGEFEGNNKLHLYLRWGGLGGGITHIVDGEKQ